MIIVFTPISAVPVATKRWSLDKRSKAEFVKITKERCLAPKRATRMGVE
jgi:hypothetical protein